MMQPFDTQSQGVGAATWLRRNASGNCSILMRTSAGIAVYLYWHDNPAGPMIYGPIAGGDIFRSRWFQPAGVIREEVSE